MFVDDGLQVRFGDGIASDLFDMCLKYSVLCYLRGEAKLDGRMQVGCRDGAWLQILCSEVL